MCGLHSYALDDLAAARKLAPATEPEWGGLLDDMLHFWTLYQMNEIGGVSSLHETTVTGIQQMSRILKRELPEHSLFPATPKRKHQKDLKKLPPRFLFYFMQGRWTNVHDPALALVPDFITAMQAETKSCKDREEPLLASFGNLLGIRVKSCWLPGR